MKTDSGAELGEIAPPRVFTAKEAIARVDSWGPPHEGSFPIHMIARALRAEIARLEAQHEEWARLAIAIGHGTTKP